MMYGPDSETFVFLVGLHAVIARRAVTTAVVTTHPIAEWLQQPNETPCERNQRRHRLHRPKKNMRMRIDAENSYLDWMLIICGPIKFNGDGDYSIPSLQNIKLKYFTRHSSVRSYIFVFTFIWRSQSFDFSHRFHQPTDHGPSYLFIYLFLCCEISVRKSAWQNRAAQFFLFALRTSHQRVGSCPNR